MAAVLPAGAMKRTLKELECMERRLNIVLEGCLTPEELEERKKNRFDHEKKLFVKRLQDIRRVSFFYFFFYRYNFLSDYHTKRSMY